MASKAAPVVNDVAENRSASALGWTKALRKKLGNDAAMDAGRVGLDEGVVTPMASTGTKLERMQAVKDAAGQQIGGTMDTLDQAGIAEFNPLGAAGKVHGEIGNAYANEPLFGGLADQYERLMKTITKRGAQNIPYKEAQELKELIGQYGYKEGVGVPGREQAQQAYGIVNKELDDAVARGAAKTGDDALLDGLKKAKGNYRAAKNSIGALEGKQAAEHVNNEVSLSDMVVAATALASPHGLAKAAVNLGAKGAATRFGNNFAAVGADNLAKILSTEPGTFGQYAAVLANAAKRGPDSLLAAHNTLLKTDPNYAKQLGGEGAK